MPSLMMAATTDVTCLQSPKLLLVALDSEVEQQVAVQAELLLLLQAELLLLLQLHCVTNGAIP
jgi:hypothetical protein